VFKGWGLGCGLGVFKGWGLGCGLGVSLVFKAHRLCVSLNARGRRRRPPLFIGYVPVAVLHRVQGLELGLRVLGLGLRGKGSVVTV